MMLVARTHPANGWRQSVGKPCQTKKCAIVFLSRWMYADDGSRRKSRREPLPSLPRRFFIFRVVCFLDVTLVDDGVRGHRIMTRSRLISARRGRNRGSLCMVVVFRVKKSFVAHPCIYMSMAASIVMLGTISSGRRDTLRVRSIFAWTATYDGILFFFRV